MTVTDIHKDPTALIMTVVSEWDAPIARVWQLWADPRKLERWWGPPTYPATVVEHESRHAQRRIEVTEERGAIRTVDDAEFVKLEWHPEMRCKKAHLVAIAGGCGVEEEHLCTLAQARAGGHFRQPRIRVAGIIDDLPDAGGRVRDRRRAAASERVDECLLAG